MKKLLCLGLALVLLFTLAACGSGVSGTYYSESGDLYIELGGAFWSMGETDGEVSLSGPYVVENGVISFRLAVEGGGTLESFTGELSGDRLVISFSGEAGTTVFYRDGKKGLLPE